MTARRADARALRVEPSSSRHWRNLVVLLHLLAVTAVLLAALPGWVRSVALVLVALSLLRDFRHGFPLYRPRDLKAIILDAGGRWEVETRQGRETARLLPSSRIWSEILWLRFQSRDRRFRVLLPADAVPRDDFRHLQRRLRNEGPAGPTGQS